MAIGVWDGNPLPAGQAGPFEFTPTSSDPATDTTLEGVKTAVEALDDKFPAEADEVKGVTSDITDDSETTVIAAQGAGVEMRITSVTVMNSHASVDTWVNLLDGAGGSSIGTLFAKAGGGGASPSIPRSGLKVSANNALIAKCETTGANVRVMASGIKVS